VHKVLCHILTPVYHFSFVLILLVFHPVQWLARNLFGDMAHRRVVYLMNGFLSRSLYILGHSIQFINRQQLPRDRPMVFVANHNSLHDIPTLYYKLRMYHPVFVSKRSLAKGLPSVSYNLRHSGAALIDRGDRMQAMKEIMKLGALIHDRRFSAVIFPEGTRRGKDLKPFKPGGMAAILKKAPDALIVPVAIEGTYKINFEKKYPMNVCQKLSWTVLPPIEPQGRDLEQLLSEARSAIASVLDKDVS